MTGTPRARSAESKEHRKLHILRTALHLSGNSKAATMESLAHACKISKGTLYLYFPTRGELHFHLGLQHFNAWRDALQNHLTDQQESLDDALLKSFPELHNFIKHLISSGDTLEPTGLKSHLTNGLQPLEAHAIQHWHWPSGHLTEVIQFILGQAILLHHLHRPTQQPSEQHLHELTAGIERLTRHLKGHP